MKKNARYPASISTIHVRMPGKTYDEDDMSVTFACRRSFRTYHYGTDTTYSHMNFCSEAIPETSYRGRSAGKCLSQTVYVTCWTASRICGDELPCLRGENCVNRPES